MSEFEESSLYTAVVKRIRETPQKVKELLKEEDADIHLKCEETGKGYLHLVVEQFEDFEDIDVEYQLIPVIYILAVRGIHVNLQDDDGLTALHYAFKKSVGPKCVNALMKVGLDPAIATNKGLRAGDYITDTTDPAMVHVLGVMCPGLWRAVDDNNYIKTELLLNSWCRIDQEKSGVSLIEYAKGHANSDIVQLLEQNHTLNRLVYYSLTGETKKMKKIFKADDDDELNVNCKDMSNVENDSDLVPMPLLGETLLLRQNEAVKLLLRKGSNVNEKVPDPNQPEGRADTLYFYIMKTYPDVIAEESFMKMLESADISQIVEFNVGVLYSAWRKKWPSEVVDYLIDKGLNLTKRSEDGYTVRDNLIVHCYTAGFDKAARKEAMMFVDRHIIQMAREGRLEALEQLALDGYENINVTNIKGKTAATLAKKAGHKEVSKYLSELQEIQRNVRKMHTAIECGNLYGTREVINKKMAFAKDRGGRTPLHKAVLYERRFIIRYIIKEYPETVNVKDDFNRTPLHFACALPECQDVEDMLLQAGADETILDVDGKTPMDIKINDGSSLIERERKKTCAIDIVCLETYLHFIDAIEEDNLEAVQETKQSMYNDLKLSELTEHMFKKPGERPLELLEACIDNGSQEIARYLINQGLDINAPVQLNNQTLSLTEACDKRHLNDLGDFVRRKKNREDEERRQQHLAENVVIGSTVSSVGSDSTTISIAYDDQEEPPVEGDTGRNSTPSDNEGRKSSACIIL